MEPSVNDSRIQLLIGSPGKGEVPSSNREQQHAQRPDIRWRPRVLQLLDNLWGHVGGRPTEHPHLHLIRDAGREPEVDDLDVAVLVHE